MTLCFVSAFLSAEQRVNHLYEARIPIQDRSADEQEAAKLVGMASVLNKISGYSGTSDYPELGDGLSGASLLISEFAIQSMKVAGEDGLSVETTDALYMRFVNNPVDQLIRDFEIPVWPAIRPNILFLVATELGGQPQLLTEITHPAAFAILNRVAFDRGIHISLLDKGTIDSLSLSGNSVWDLDAFVLESDLALLPIDRIGVLRLQLGPDSNQYGDLNVLDASEFSADLEGRNFSEALTSALNQYIDHLSLETAFVASSAVDTRVMLSVQGAPDFMAFNRVREYLLSLEQVENTKLIRLSTEEFVFQLQFQSGLQLLRSSLSNSGFLVPMDEEVSVFTDISEISYRYRVPLQFPSQLGAQ